MAIRPSRPAPSKRSNQARAIASSRVIGVTWIGGAASASARSSAARRSANGSLGEVVVAEREQVEGDEAGRGLGGEQRDAARGGVDALLERPEVQAAVAGDDDLAVDDARAAGSCA